MENKQLTPFYKTIVGVQFLFVAFGATVLVPLLVGLDPSTALFTAGVGTLVFHLVTKGIVPIFLGSSFAFIAPIVKSYRAVWFSWDTFWYGGSWFCVYSYECTCKMAGGEAN
jgi:xanthine/uracil permease